MSGEKVTQFDPLKLALSNSGAKSTHLYQDLLS